MRTSYQIQYASTSGDNYENLSQSLKIGVTAALEIGPQSEVDSVLVSGHNFTDQPLSVGCGIVGPLTGPLTFRGYPYTAQSNGLTKYKIPMLEIVAHSYYPNTWMQKRAPLGYKTVVGVTLDAATTFMEVPFYGRKGGMVWIANSGGNSIDYTVIAQRYRNQAGGNPFQTTWTNWTAIASGSTANKKFSDEYVESVIVQIRNTVAGQASACEIEAEVTD